MMSRVKEASPSDHVKHLGPEGQYPLTMMHPARARVRRRPSRALAAAGAFSLVGAASAGIAQAAAGDGPATGAALQPLCPVRLEAPQGADGWSAVVDELVAELHHGGAGDCGGIVIAVTGRGASIVFATTDGRQAVRTVAAPNELLSAVHALLVAGLSSSSPPSPTPLPAPPAPTPAGSSVRPATLGALGAATGQIRPAGTPGESGVRITASLASGARLGAPGVFVSPAFSARATILVRRWELGVNGQWQPTFLWTGGQSPESFSMHEYAIGIHAGRRQPVGAAAIDAGIDGRVAIYEESGDSAGAGTQGSSQGNNQGGGGSAAGSSPAEPLVGLYAGLVIPERSPLRLRAQISADAAVARLGTTLVVDPALPPLPWLSVGGSLGIEGEIP